MLQKVIGNPTVMLLTNSDYEHVTDFTN